MAPVCATIAALAATWDGAAGDGSGCVAGAFSPGGQLAVVVDIVGVEPVG
jgi:hypothetical protein